MKIVNRILTTAALGAALLATAQAEAATFAFSYFGAGVTASGTFTTADAATSATDVLSITGTRNGTLIQGLVPLDSDDQYSYDNQFVNAAPYFTSGGLLYDIGGTGADAHINLYFDDTDGAFHDLRLNADASAITDTVVTFTVSAVPEPATMALMGLGLGAVGLFARRRNGAKAAAVAA